MSSIKKAISGVIFDCDGTLVDSETLSTRLIVKMLEEQGHRTSYEEIFKVFRGEKLSMFIDKIKKSYSSIEPDSFISEYRERSTQLLQTELQEIEGAKRLLEKIDLDKCIASNGPRHKIETSLTSTNLLPFFTNRIVSAYEVNAWKPSPEIIIHAANLMNQPPGNCLFIDDSMAGIEAGVKAKAQVVAFRISNEALGEYKNWVICIDDLSEVLELLN